MEGSDADFVQEQDQHEYVMMKIKCNRMTDARQSGTTDINSSRVFRLMGVKFWRVTSGILYRVSRGMFGH